MGFKSFIGSWFGSFVAAGIWATVLAYFFRDTIDVHGILLNSMVLSIMFSGLVWLSSLAFRPVTLLHTVVIGWVFTFGFQLVQHTFNMLDLTQMLVSVGFGLVVGGASYLGLNFFRKAENSK